VELRTKRELLEGCSFEEIVRVWKKDGARLTPKQVELLEDALWQGYRKVVHHEPKAMTDAQRNVKKDYVDGAASSFADLEAFVALFRGHRWTRPAWFSMKDLVRALPINLLSQVVSDLAWIGERDYADAMLAGLRSYYSTHGETLVVMREPTWAGTSVLPISKPAKSQKKAAKPSPDPASR
jgi:hypothetical protein